MAVTAAITAALSSGLSSRGSCTGIITIAARMPGSTVSLFTMHMLSRLGTALYVTYAYNAAGTVAITTGMIITAVGLIIMNMISCLRTSLYVTYAYRAAGTVAITAGMIVTAVGLTIMGVQSSVHTVRNCTKSAHLIRGNRCLYMMSMSRYRHYHQSCRQQTCRTICQYFSHPHCSLTSMNCHFYHIN